jgi:hypothetical protein
MTGEMSCHAAHNGPFDAPFSIRSAGGREKRNCRQRACKGLVHRFLLPLMSCGFETRQTIKSSNGPFSQPSIRSPSFGRDDRFNAPGNRGLARQSICALISNLSAIVSPMQQRLSLSRSTKWISGIAVLLNLRNVPTERFPSSDLPCVLDRRAAPHVVATIPLEPAPGIIRVNPALLAPDG